MLERMQFCLGLLLFFLGGVSSELQSFKVTLDPGHGGKFTGAQGVTTHVFEKNLTLSIAQMLAKELKAQGINVVLTRESDVALDDDLMTDLRKRAAKGDDADLFVSMHLNQVGSVHKQGFELYIPYNESEMPLLSYMCANFMHHNLAHSVSPSWSGALKNYNEMDGGIRQAKFNVINLTKSKAAVLLELEYLSNPAGEKRIKDESYQKMLVRSIAKAILAYKDTGK